jgi:ribonuclease BN (tRNA processing enzyme)
MRLEVLGFSPPYPNPGEATSGYLVETSDTRLLIDCGHGIAAEVRARFPEPELDAVVLSHMHPDHCLDLFALRNVMYYTGRDPVPLWLPSGAEEILAGLVHGLGLPDTYFDCAFAVSRYTPGDAFEVGGVAVRTTETKHSIRTAMLDLQAAGDRIVYTADTAWFDELPALCKGADLVLAECTNFPPSDRPETRWHLGPPEISRLAAATSLESLLLVHYDATQADALRTAVADLCDAPPEAVKLATGGLAPALR